MTDEDEDDFLAHSMMINAKNIIMKDESESICGQRGCASAAFERSPICVVSDGNAVTLKSSCWCGSGDDHSCETI